MENQIEEPVQALTGEQVEKDTPEDTQPIPAADRPLHTWPNDDVKRVVRAFNAVKVRGVSLLLICDGCEKALTLEGADNGGAALMGCGCCVRRWL
jgi:hypothetical protein